MTASDVVILVVRHGLVILFFPANSLDKTLNFDGSVTQALQAFSSRGIAVALILVGVFIEVVMPIGILSGVADRLAAFIMTGHSVGTAVLFRRFWEPGDFLASGKSQGRELFLDFLKNFPPASGFILVVVGLDGHSWLAFIHHLLSSSQPYAASPLPR